VSPVVATPQQSPPEARGVGSPRPGRLHRVLVSEHFVLLLTLLYFVLLLPLIPRLASAYNLGNLLSNVWPLLAVAVGQTVVLIVGGIDLSQTAIMATASVLGAAVMTSAVDPLLFAQSPLWGVLLGPEGGALAGSGWAVPAGIALMLLAGAAIGLLNGVSVARLGMPPFMVTLVTMIFFGAVAIYLTRSENVAGLPAGFTALGREGVGPLPWALLVVGALALGTHLLLRRTVLGHWLYAVGMNPRAARISGVPTERVVIFAYAFSGLCAALAAVFYSARLEAGRPTLGQSLLLDVVGATVIGGTSLFGGKGKVLWTVYGVLFFALLANTLNLLNLSFYTVGIVKGGVIVLAALLDVLRTRFAAVRA
jgi:ribose/xylose/arabinose/galactoside ABC-type transport system permease subunit